MKFNRAEDTICDDSGYTGADKREELQGVEAAFWIAEKPSKLRALKNKRERKYGSELSSDTKI